MKTHPDIGHLNIDRDFYMMRGAYPPLGFVAVLDAELGNGDYFGLYWPYGLESREPLICDMAHDEGTLMHAFSGVGVFLEWLEANDWNRGEVEVADPKSVKSRYMDAKTLIREDPDGAIEVLRSLCEDFPEDAEIWFSLAAQLRRTGDQKGGTQAAIRSFTSNWVFGMPPHGVLRMLQSGRGVIEDPVIARSDRLTATYGGLKTNDNYPLIREIISEYLESGLPVRALLMNQNYGFMMSCETTAFQERYNFDADDWCRRHTELCLAHLGDDRQWIG